jgi:ABC-type antimicrobial peptide transport system permease subunit
MNEGAAALPAGATILVRSPTGSDVIGAVRAEVAAIDPNLTVFNTRTMTEQLSQMNTMIQFASFFYGGIGIFGLILAAIGLSGVTAYAVARRYKEMASEWR